MKSITACFTGHRPKSLPWGYDETKESCKKFKEALKNVVIEAVNKGYTNFLTGMAEGFDMMAAETVLDLKKQFKNLKLIAVIPCENQSAKWAEAEQQRYQDILQHCDEKIVLSEKYTPTCMNKRNMYMAERSGLCIACFNGKPSGTGNTIKFAKAAGCEVKILNPNDYK